MRDIIIREVPHYGFLPIIQEDGKETYRGEFQRTAAEALERAENALEGMKHALCLHPVFGGICEGLLAAQKLAS